MGVIARRVGLLVTGALALWILVKLHGLEQRKSQPKFDITEVKMEATGTSPSDPSSMVDAAMKKLRSRGKTIFATREDFYSAIDGALAVPLPVPAPEKAEVSSPRSRTAAQAAEHGTVTDEATKHFESMVLVSRELAVEEETFRKTLTVNPPVAHVHDQEHRSAEAQLARFVERRQRLNQIYLSRAMALASYDTAMRQSVRRYLETLSDEKIGMIAAKENKFIKAVGDREHPLHVIFDLLWYAALVVAVLSFTAFIATGLLSLLGLPELREAFTSRASKLMDQEIGKEKGGGVMRTAGALASAAVIGLLGVGTIAGSVGGTSSSPWTHADLLTGGASSHESRGANGGTGPAGVRGPSGGAGREGAFGAAGDPGAAGIPGLQGEAGVQGDPGAPGQSGVVTHRVEVAPVRLDASQIVLTPEFEVPPAPVPDIVNTMPAPPGWIDRFVEMNHKVDNLDQQVRNEVKAEVKVQVDGRIGPVEGDVKMLAGAREAELASVTTVDTAGQWAWMPWHREFHVSRHEIELIERAVGQYDRENVVEAVRKLEGKRLRYFSFVSAFRSAVTDVMTAKALHARDVDGVMDRNTSVVLSVCRVRR